MPNAACGRRPHIMKEHALLQMLFDWLERIPLWVFIVLLLIVVAIVVPPAFFAAQ